MALTDCAELSLGYSFRGRIEAVDTGAIRLVQMRDLTDDNFVNAGSAVRCEDPGFSEVHYLRSGDLVFRARGANNMTAYAAEIKEPTALASPLARMRVRGGIADPRYLQWFLNLQSSQAYLAAGSQGSLVRMVSIEHLGRLPVVLPPPGIQRRVAELAGLYTRESEILGRLGELAELKGRIVLEQMILGTQGRDYGNED